MGRILDAAALAAALVVLGACDQNTAPPAPFPPADEAQRAPANPASARPPRPARKPPTPDTSTPEVGAGETASTSAGRVDAGSPEQLIGLDQNNTEALLGKPSERREAPPATIWRYLGQNCELDVYFYFDLQSRVMRALHYEVKSHDSTEPARNHCFAELVAEPPRPEPDHPVGASPPR